MKTKKIVLITLPLFWIITSLSCYLGLFIKNEFLNNEGIQILSLAISLLVIFILSFIIIYYKEKHETTKIALFFILCFSSLIVIFLPFIFIWVGVIYALFSIYGIFLLIYYYTFFYSYLKKNNIIN